MTFAIDLFFGWDSQVNGPNALHPRSLRSCGKWFTTWLVILAAWIQHFDSLGKFCYDIWCIQTFLWFLLSFSGLQSILAKESQFDPTRPPLNTPPSPAQPTCMWMRRYEATQVAIKMPGNERPPKSIGATDVGHVWIFSSCQWILKETLWYNITQSPSTNNLC